MVQFATLPSFDEKREAKDESAFLSGFVDVVWKFNLSSSATKSGRNLDPPSFPLVLCLLMKLASQSPTTTFWGFSPHASLEES